MRRVSFCHNITGACSCRVLCYQTVGTKQTMPQTAVGNLTTSSTTVTEPGCMKACTGIHIAWLSMVSGRPGSRFQVPKGAGRLLHCPVDLDLNVGPSAIPCEIPVITGYLMRICEIS